MDGADWLRSQLTAFGCSSCGRGYRPSQIRVLAHREELWFVRLSCGRCGEQTDAIVTIQVDDGEGRQIDAGELARLQSEAGADAETGDAEPAAPAVTAEDVLAMHEFLRDFEGDFRTLFGDRGSGHGRSARTA